MIGSEMMVSLYYVEPRAYLEVTLINRSSAVYL